MRTSEREGWKWREWGVIREGRRGGERRCKKWGVAKRRRGREPGTEGEAGEIEAHLSGMKW